MAIENKTIAEINSDIIAQLEASLNQTIPLLPKSFLRVLAKTFAAVYVALYKYGGFIFLQQYVKTSSHLETEINGKDLIPLVEIGRERGVSDPTLATNAELRVDITVLNQVGILPSGTQLIGQKNGVTYITVGSTLLNAPIVQATIKAVADQSGNNGGGVIGNLDNGDLVSFANPLANIDKTATVTEQLVTGADAEDLNVVYRQRVLDVFQKPPQGGAYSDYEIWGEEAAGIINVYPYTGIPGQVDIYSEATVASSGNPDGIPTTAQLEAVLDLINFDENGLAGRRNTNAFVNSYPIIRTGFSVTIQGISGVSDLGQVQSDISAAMTEYFLSVEPYIPGLSIPPRNDQITRTRISAIAEDIITADGGTFTGAGFFIAVGEGLPQQIYVVGKGEKAKMTSISYV